MHLSNNKQISQHLIYWFLLKERGARIIFEEIWYIMFTPMAQDAASKLCVQISCIVPERVRRFQIVFVLSRPRVSINICALSVAKPVIARPIQVMGPVGLVLDAVMFPAGVMGGAVRSQTSQECCHPRSDSMPPDTFIINQPKPCLRQALKHFFEVINYVFWSCC